MYSGNENRFKGLDLIDRLPEELWKEVCDIVQETGIKTIPMEMIRGELCSQGVPLSEVGHSLQVGKSAPFSQ